MARPSPGNFDSLFGQTHRPEPLRRPWAPAPSPPRKRITSSMWFKLALGAGLVVVVCSLMPSKKDDTTASVTVSQEAPRAVVYAVTPSGLNLRNGPSLTSGVITVLSQHSQVQLVEGQNSKRGAWWKVTFGQYQGWVDSSLLQPVLTAVTGLQVRNWDGKNDVWISQPGEALKAGDVGYLCPLITYDASTSGEITFYIKIINQDGGIWRSEKSPAGYTYMTTEIIQPGTGNTLYLDGWGSDAGGSYSAGFYTIEVWAYGTCLNSEKIRLY